MYEDLQDDFYQSEHLKKGKKAVAGIAVFILFVLIWAAVACIVVVLFYPRISSALSQTGAVEIFSNLRKTRENASSYDAELCFIKMNENSYSLVLYPSRAKRTGESIYHDVMEALLNGPQTEAVNDGAVSFIPDNVRLEGLTVSGNTAFVSFSSPFAEAGENAKRQVRATLNAVDEKITDVVFLVGDTEV